MPVTEAKRIESKEALNALIDPKKMQCHFVNYTQITLVSIPLLS